MACWPLVENHHERRHPPREPGPGAGAVDGTRCRRAAEQLAARLLDDLDHVGVLAVELFDVGGELLANEIAPRVHNSGHWTIEGAETSQFENHLRAVLGLAARVDRRSRPERDGQLHRRRCPTRDAVLAVPGAHLHDYGKAPRAGRKLGHVTVVGDDDDDELALPTRCGAREARLSSDGCDRARHARRQLGIASSSR